MASTSSEACDLCGITFESPILYNIHSWSHVPYENVPNFIENVTKCAECDSQLGSNEEWRNHATSSHGRSLYSCTFCALIYVDLESLTNHALKSHSRCLNLVRRKAKFGCVLCGIAFSVANALCQHLQSSHSQISVILIDKNIYPSSETYNASHQNQNTPVKSILRIRNGQNISGNDGNYQVKEDCSKNSHDGQSNPRNQSPRVKKVTFFNDPIKVMEKPPANRASVDAPNQKYRCGLCGSSFKHGIQLEIHRREKHKAIIGSLKPKFGCGCCNANFYSKKFVRKHIAKHHNIDITPKKVI